MKITVRELKKIIREVVETEESQMGRPKRVKPTENETYREILDILVSGDADDVDEVNDELQQFVGEELVYLNSGRNKASRGTIQDIRTLVGHLGELSTVYVTVKNGANQSREVMIHSYEARSN